jgi:hypothetical protein
MKPLAGGDSRRKSLGKSGFALADWPKGLPIDIAVNSLNKTFVC